MRLRIRINKENLIYLIVWLMLFIAPVISLYIRTQNDSDIEFDRTELFGLWKIYAVYLIVFLIHNFVLAPLLIYRQRKTLYLTTTLCLVAVFAVYQYMSRPGHDEMRRIRRHNMEMEMRNGCVPQNQGNHAPDDMGPHQDMGPGNRHKPDRKPDLEKERNFGPPFFFAGRDIVSTVILVLLIGMNLGVKLYFKSDEDAKEMQQLEKQNLQQQLEYLKYQINPHFFMNTLNNIHALVDIDPEKAKTTIVELSKMMRYILYEGNKSLIPLQCEIQFLRNYITLMKLRYTNKVKISLELPEKYVDYEIPPLMLITFVENAFKHGVSYQQESYINIEMHYIGNRLIFCCKNSKSKSEAEISNMPKQGGVGLTNVKKRLNLIYADNYTLDINNATDCYEVKLDLPMHQS